MNYGLPKSLEIGGKDYAIRYDFRCILDICEAIEDPELTFQDKAAVAVEILYPDWQEIPEEHREEALRQCFWFINGGAENRKENGPSLMSWKKDIPYIIPPVNRALGREIREIPYDETTNCGGLHWWSFLSGYMEIGDCLFAQIIRIRSLKADGKPLDKFDQEWYRRNQQLVDIEQAYTREEEDFLRQLGIDV